MLGCVAKVIYRHQVYSHPTRTLFIIEKLNGAAVVTALSLSIPSFPNTFQFSFVHSPDNERNQSHEGSDCCCTTDRTDRIRFLCRPSCATWTFLCQMCVYNIHIQCFRLSVKQCIVRCADQNHRRCRRRLRVCAIKCECVHRNGCRRDRCEFLESREEKKTSFFSSFRSLRATVWCAGMCVSVHLCVCSGCVCFFPGLAVVTSISWNWFGCANGLAKNDDNCTVLIPSPMWMCARRSSICWLTFPIYIIVTFYLYKNVMRDDYHVPLLCIVSSIWPSRIWFMMLMMLMWWWDGCLQMDNE